MAKETGGSAFPTEDVVNGNGEFVRYGAERLTVRDWFAGMALQGLISAHTSQEQLRSAAREAEKHNATMAEFFAQFAFNQADEMLKQRQK